MSPLVTGALIGLAAGLGLMIVALCSPPARPVRLADRLAPYLREAPRPSRLLVGGRVGSTTMTGAVGRLVGPWTTGLGGAIDRFVGGRQSVRRRLDALENDATVEDFRLEQVVWGAIGLGLGVLAGVALSLLTGQAAFASILLLAAGGVVGGVLGRDWWLTRQVREREERMLLEFPVVADLLALAVTAGEGPVGAIERVCSLVGGELGRSLRLALARSRTGTPLAESLQRLADATSLEPLSRFVDGVVVALERGTPLAEVLRAQAADVREAGKRRLLEQGGRKELAMMVPVVFIVLPVTVIFALYPGLFAIVQLAR